MTIRSEVLDRTHVFEYDVGLWAFGTVQVLKDRETGELKTCKTVPKVMARSAEATARLRRLRELQHQHVSGITDVLEDQTRLYILSDKCAGGDVAEWMVRVQEDGNWLQERTVAEYVRQTLVALAHAHGGRICHRDLRPSSLALSSKLPDAKVMVTDLGLAEIFDPLDRTIARCANPFAAPEIDGRYGADGAVPQGAPADLWGVGAIAHQLLVGSPPSREDSSSWAALARRGSQALLRSGGETDGWQERSSLSRDFVRRLLQHRPEDRPTAAQALQHPWIQACVSLDPDCWNLADEATRTLRSRVLCFMLALFLLPARVQCRDLMQLRSAFLQVDLDRDGFIPQLLAHRLLKERGAPGRDAAVALDAVDVTQTSSVGLCALLAAHLLARDFCGRAARPEEPARGPGDLVPGLLQAFFLAFGDDPHGRADVQRVFARLSLPVVAEVEAHAGVRYDELVALLPDEGPFDSQALTDAVLEGQCRGTPFHADDESDSEEGSEKSWGETLGLDRVQNLFKGVFQTCGLHPGLRCGHHCDVVPLAGLGATASDLGWKADFRDHRHEGFTRMARGFGGS